VPDPCVKASYFVLAARRVVYQKRLDVQAQGPMPTPIYLIPEIAERRGLRARLARRIGGLVDRFGQGLVHRGVPPLLFASRYRRRVPAARAASRLREVHAPCVVRAPLPGGVARAGDLPDDPGWWGFSFRSVAARPAGPTRLIVVEDARVLARSDPQAGGDYVPAVLDAAGRSLELREIRFRPIHAALAARPPDLVMDEAVWVAERVFHNYAHWFTAHLPKLVMLRDQGLLDGLVLPAGRPAWVDESLARIGISALRELPTPGVLAAGRLTLVESDRFRPELLQAARDAIAGSVARPDRRVFVSRREARGRRLLGEEALAPALRRAGFDLVAMEALSLSDQIALMARTQVLLAPHGAGLTNMLFCPPGTRIGEIADPAYPNPNFYAMAAALGHEYHYLRARGEGDRHPLRQDLRLAADDLAAFLDRLA
jgi:hypothetical protein